MVMNNEATILFCFMFNNVILATFFFWQIIWKSRRIRILRSSRRDKILHNYTSAGRYRCRSAYFIKGVESQNHNIMQNLHFYHFELNDAVPGHTCHALLYCSMKSIFGNDVLPSLVNIFKFHVETCIASYMVFNERRLTRTRSQFFYCSTHNFWK